MTEQSEREAVVADRKAFHDWLLWGEGDPDLNEELCDALSAEIRKQREAGIYCAHPIFKLFADALVRGDHIKESSNE